MITQTDPAGVRYDSVIKHGTRGMTYNFDCCRIYSMVKEVPAHLLPVDLANLADFMRRNAATIAARANGGQNAGANATANNNPPGAAANQPPAHGSGGGRQRASSVPPVDAVGSRAAMPRASANNNNNLEPAGKVPDVTYPSAKTMTAIGLPVVAPCNKYPSATTPAANIPSAMTTAGTTPLIGPQSDQLRNTPNIITSMASGNTPIGFQTKAPAPLTSMSHIPHDNPNVFKGIMHMHLGNRSTIPIVSIDTLKVGMDARAAEQSGGAAEVACQGKAGETLLLKKPQTTTTAVSMVIGTKRGPGNTGDGNVVNKKAKTQRTPGVVETTTVSMAAQAKDGPVE